MTLLKISHAIPQIYGNATINHCTAYLNVTLRISHTGLKAVSMLQQVCVLITDGEHLLSSLNGSQQHFTTRGQCSTSSTSTYIVHLPLIFPTYTELICPSMTKIQSDLRAFISQIQQRQKASRIHIKTGLLMFFTQVHNKYNRVPHFEAT